MPRKLPKLAALLTIALALSFDGSAFAQERLFVYEVYSNTLAELETDESRLGVIRRLVKIPFAVGDALPVPLAGGRFLIIDRRVELTWRDPGDATHFLVQAGTESDAAISPPFTSATPRNLRRRSRLGAITFARERLTMLV